jgi:hypothetical protein
VILDPLLWMLIGHAVADYPLQGDWLSKAKNHRLLEIQGPLGPIWPGALASHAAIHAGAVKLATGSWLLAGCEFIAHAAIDRTKCSGRLSYNGDQALHLACKLFWFGLILVHGQFP